MEEAKIRRVDSEDAAFVGLRGSRRCRNPGRADLATPASHLPGRQAPSGKFPPTNRSRPACRNNCCRIESEEFNDAAPVGFGRAVLVLLPFFDGRVGDSNSQHFGQFAL